MRVKKNKYNPVDMMSRKDFEKFIATIADNLGIASKERPHELFTNGHFIKNDGEKIYKRRSTKEEWQEMTNQEAKEILGLK